MTWRPLIDDADGRIAGVIAELVAALAPATDLDCTVDRALLHGYLGIDDGGDALTAAVTVLAEGGHGAGLFGGAARVGWAVAHLADGDDADEVCAAVDRHVSRAIADPAGHYDLISGLVGFGVYALERGNTALALEVLGQLERRSSPAAIGTTWFTLPALLPPFQVEETPDGHHDLGLAHGVAGVIAVLARFLAAGVAPARSRALLDGAVAYLRSFTPPYPAWAPSAQHGLRLAWCYNDLGVAAGLAAAGVDVTELARACAACPIERAGVRDAVICHGSIGNAHLFNRLWQATGDAALADAARAWIDDAITRGRPDGWPMWTTEGLKHDTSILTGAAGVALVLQAAISADEPLWDRLLLLDLATG